MISEIQFPSPIDTNLNCAAFDLGTTTGVSTLVAGTITCQRIQFKNAAGRKTMPDDHPGYRFSELFAYLTALFDQNKYDFIFYEEPGSFRNVMTSRVPFGMRAILLAAAAAADIPVKGVHVQTLKKAATGSARSEKFDMIIAAEKKYPACAGEINHDQADSLCLLTYGIDQVIGA